MKDYIGQLDTSLLDNGVLNPAWPENDREVGTITTSVVHHSATNEVYAYEDAPLYQSEAEYQNNTSIPGSRGLQYHYKIDNVGQIMQIRPHTVYLWHCGNLDVNKASLAICLDGDFQTGHQQPTREQYEALSQLLTNLSTEHPEFPAVQSDVYAHRQFSSTDCCGDNLVPFVNEYRANNGNASIPDVPYQHPELQPTAPAAPAATSVPAPVEPQQNNPVVVETPGVPAPGTIVEPVVADPVEPAVPVSKPTPTQVTPAVKVPVKMFSTPMQISKKFHQIILVASMLFAVGGAVTQYLTSVESVTLMGVVTVIAGVLEHAYITQP